MDSPAIRRLLHELAGALPEDGPSQVTGLSVRQGWGGIVSVRVHTLKRAAPESEVGAAVRAAVQRALGTQRHELTFVSEGTSRSSPAAP